MVWGAMALAPSPFRPRLRTTCIKRGAMWRFMIFLASHHVYGAALAYVVCVYQKSLNFVDIFNSYTQKNKRDLV